MWDPYEPGEPIDTLLEVNGFVLVSAAVREGVVTEHGVRTAVDLVVQTTKAGVTRTFSGFPAGVAAQVKKQGPTDLPAICRLVDQPTTKGNPTKALELVQALDAGADLVKLAAVQGTPIEPVKNGQTNAVPL